MSLAISSGWLRKHSTSNVQLRHEWGVKIDVENTTLTAGRFVGWMAVQSSRKTSNQATTRRPGYSPHGLTKKRRKSKREIVIRPFQRASQFIRIISSLFPFAISIWHVPSHPILIYYPGRQAVAQLLHPWSQTIYQRDMSYRGYVLKKINTCYVFSV